jgi:hypothetical protein
MIVQARNVSMQEQVRGCRYLVRRDHLNFLQPVVFTRDSHLAGRLRWQVIVQMAPGIPQRHNIYIYNHMKNDVGCCCFLQSRPMEMELVC